MEFRFNLNELFHEPCVEIGNTLIPSGFSGDKRALWDTQSKITQIVNAMGEASAHAQGLSKPITTADRLRNSEHRLYLLIDQTANNGKGAVTGMLKTGEKGLYVFDRDGQHYQVSPPCVLDFYIHESRQRSGLGRRLFEHMLEKEEIEPVRMAIDRPSDKFLGFLNKHYGLNTPVKQMNNYVVFDGFFPKSTETPRSVPSDKSNTPTKKQSANGLQQGYPTSPYGRYAAARPTCSMGQIIHNDSPIIKRQEPTGVKSEPITNVQGGQDYCNNFVYGNQPAWQNTQSVPNMHQPAYPQNPQFYPQNQNMPQNPYNYNYMTQGDATAKENQFQNYYYTPQNQQNVVPPSPQPVKTKEPLIPQSFDGSLRKMPQVVQSMPVQNLISAPTNNIQYSQSANFVPQNAPINNFQQQNSTPAVNQNQAVLQQSQINPGVFQANPNINQHQHHPVINQNEIAQQSQMNLNSSQNNAISSQNQNAISNQMNHSEVLQNQNQMLSNVQNQPSLYQISNRNITQQQHDMHQEIYNQVNMSQQYTQQMTNQQIPVNNNELKQPEQNQPQMAVNNAGSVQHLPQIMQNNSEQVLQNAQQIATNNVQQMDANNNVQNAGQHQQNLPQIVANNNVQNAEQVLQNTQQQNLLHNNVQNLLQHQQNSLSNVASSSMEEQAKIPCYEREIDLSKGYPPQLVQNPAQSNGSTPCKADRPNSLNIETVEDELFIKPEETALHEGHGDIDSLDGDAVDAIEEEIRKVEIAPKTSTRRGSKSPGIEAAGIVTPGRNTPGLTDQGYFDLKFYHNKLW